MAARFEAHRNGGSPADHLQVGKRRLLSDVGALNLARMATARALSPFTPTCLLPRGGMQRSLQAMLSSQDARAGRPRVSLEVIRYAIEGRAVAHHELDRQRHRVRHAAHAFGAAAILGEPPDARSSPESRAFHVPGTLALYCAVGADSLCCTPSTQRTKARVERTMKCFDAPPVPAQFFLSSELQTAPGLNTVAYAVRLLGSLDADRLESALRVLVSRHAALRSRFQLADAKVQVWVAEHSSRQVLEVRDTPPSEAALQEAVVALRGSLLPESLLWRALLLRHDAFDHTFVLTAHRCIWDEPSARTFGHELSEVYRERLGGSAAEQPAALETTTTPSKADSEAGANHFAAGLTGAPPIHEFPLLGRRPRVFPVAAAEVQVAVTQNAISLLPAFATAIGLEPFDVVVAAASCVFARYCRHSTVALGFPFDLRGLGGEIGSNSATLPIGFDVSDGVDFASFCRAFAARLQDGRRYAKTPFEAILKARRAHAEPSANPLFQLACAQATELRLDLDACACSPRSVPTAPQQVDLFLEIGGDRIIVAYASELISGDVAASFARSIGVLLDAALSDPSRGLTRLPLLDEVEHRRIAFELNQTARPEFKECDLFALITRHFHGDSAKPALISNGRARSYAELAEDVERIRDA